MQLPTGKFDGVICTDVLEHCPEEDIGWILAELFSYATKFIFANAATFPAHKRLPSGGNAHCTIRPARWWEEQFLRASRLKPGVAYEFRITYLTKDNQLQDKTVASNAVSAPQ
jgi:hypothetical protein